MNLWTKFKKFLKNYRYCSSITGRYIKKEEALANPATSEKEKV